MVRQPDDPELWGAAAQLLGEGSDPDQLPDGTQRHISWRTDQSHQLKINIGGH